MALVFAKTHLIGWKGRRMEVQTDGQEDADYSLFPHITTVTGDNKDNLSFDLQINVLFEERGRCSAQGICIGQQHLADEGTARQAARHSTAQA